jgi:hypothetical protein
LHSVKVFIEIGKRKTFASAVDWPGWCRSGGDEESALQTLSDYIPRYAQLLHSCEIEFITPKEVFDFKVTERLEGNTTTDFGAPAIILDADREPIDQIALERSLKILQACWQAFDNATYLAKGKALRKGPRGGGKDLDKIIEHILEADRGYLSRLAWKHKRESEIAPIDELSRTRQAIQDALEAAVTGDLPERGPRGGIIWPPRYFIRRIAWHVLDHAWEIEDRIA